MIRDQSEIIKDQPKPEFFSKLLDRSKGDLLPGRPFAGEGPEYSLPDCLRLSRAQRPMRTEAKARP